MSERYLTLPVASLAPDPQQPRKELENDSGTVNEATTLQGLANSISEVGILQPIRVRPVGSAGAGAAQYTIVSGQRRYEAAKMLGMESVPCLVIDDPVDASHTLVSQVAENLQRKSMTASELAIAVQTLTQSGATQEEVATKLGIQASQVSLLLNLLVLAGPVKLAFERGRIESPRAAYDLNRLPVQLQAQLIDEAEQNGRILTQRDVREVKLMHAQRLSAVRNRYEAPNLTSAEYQAFIECLPERNEDHYDPSDDRNAMFGPGWTRLHEAQTNVQGFADSAVKPCNAADTVDALRVRVPGFTLTRDQAERLYALLNDEGPGGGMDASLPNNVSDADVSKELGRDLARLLSDI